MSTSSCFSQSWLASSDSDLMVVVNWISDHQNKIVPSAVTYSTCFKTESTVINTMLFCGKCVIGIYSMAVCREVNTGGSQVNN